MFIETKYRFHILLTNLFMFNLRKNLVQTLCGEQYVLSSKKSYHSTKKYVKIT